jgi:putative ABC transport system permease protein
MKIKLRDGWYDLLRSAFADFTRNKTRTFLTALGITIGVLSVVLLIALGLGLKNYINQQFESLGANLVMVMPGNAFSQSEGGGMSNMRSMGTSFMGITFDEQDYLALNRIGNIDYLTPLFYKSGVIEGNNQRKTGSIEGANEDIFNLMNVEIMVGDAFSKADVSSRAKKVVLGYSMAESLFYDPKEAYGKSIDIDNQRFKVVGVAKKKGDPDMDDAVIVPYKTTFGTLNPNKTFYSIYAGISSKDKVAEVKEQMKTVLLKKYKKDEFSVVEQTEILNTINQIFTVINAVLVAIGSISLLVGGIGIMNIMYATVTERTKEVGIRRAIGATERDIMMQFLAEAVTLSVLGGVLGLILATLIVLVIRIFFPASINLLSVIITFAISSAIGVGFGVFPARRAAKLPPIEAIRYE